MDKPMEIDEIRIDPSPFQLVERTSLHKVGAASAGKAVVILSIHLCNNCILNMRMEKFFNNPKFINPVFVQFLFINLLRFSFLFFGCFTFYNL